MCCICSCLCRLIILGVVVVIAVAVTLMVVFLVDWDKDSTDSDPQDVFRNAAVMMNGFGYAAIGRLALLWYGVYKLRNYLY